jgi:hypothetical protein
MAYSLFADLVLILHLMFVLYVLFGGLLALKWRRAAWLHLPGVAWGAFVEFSGLICPLTPLENWLRAHAGKPGHSGDFVDRYLRPLLYPDMLTRDVQLALGVLVLVVNLGIYGWLWRARRRG